MSTRARTAAYVGRYYSFHCGNYGGNAGIRGGNPTDTRSITTSITAGPWNFVSGRRCDPAAAATTQPFQVTCHSVSVLSWCWCAVIALVCCHSVGVLSQC